MSTDVSKVRAAFDLARAGNFPSVASNVLAALVLTSVTSAVAPPAGLLGLAIIGGCLVYAGGAEFDRRHRPHRAIPSGAFSRGGAAGLGAMEMLLGLGLLVLALHASAWWAAALAGTILAYDWIHKRWIGSVILMAGCRVLLAVTLGSMPGQLMGRPFFFWVASLFVYIVVLSLLARWEYKPGAPAAKLGRAVGGLLAFIPLIDAIALLLVGAWIPAMACAAAVPLGRLAQRLAAST